MGKLREIGAELFVMAAIGLTLGLIGPVDTFALPVMARLATWLLLGLLGYACFRPVIAAGDALSAEASVPRPLALAVACAIAALPMAAIVCWIFGGFATRAITARQVAAPYPYVFLIGGMATAVQVLLFGGRRAVAEDAVVPAAPPAAAEAAAAAPPPPPTPLFLDRLPGALGRELLCLEMEDHYVRAHTAAGSTLILMRLRDAVAELEGVAGARVHRSWWVARPAVAEVLRRERATVLRLVNGLEVPVARTALPRLRGDGWL